VRGPVGLGLGPDRFGDPVDVVEVRDHLDRVVDRDIVEPDRAQRVGFGRADRGGIEGQLPRVVAERPRARIQV
jgi:hypothetical protein